MWDFPIHPEQASTVAASVDELYFALWGITIFFTLLIFVLVAVFAVKYRRGKPADRSNPPESNHRLEMVWIVIPLGIALAIFGWATKVAYDILYVPQDAMEIHAVAKQWMWKFQNPEGRREVNVLHIPTGRDIKVTMISQDVLHDLYFPAFRVKMDVVPGRYTQLWFNATKPGTYHIFCAEYCGLQHSGMIGKVVVMTPEDYADWLSGGTTNELPSEAGKRLFTQLGCNTCHGEQPNSRGPSLTGVYGSTVQLRDGNTVVADDDYIRESIYTPATKVVNTYDAIMPTYQGQVTEEQVIQIIAYIKTLQTNATTTNE